MSNNLWNMKSSYEMSSTALNCHRNCNGSSLASGLVSCALKLSCAKIMLKSNLLRKIQFVFVWNSCITGIDMCK